MPLPGGKGPSAPIDLTLSSDDESNRQPRMAGPAMLGDSGRTSVKPRRPPRILASDDEDTSSDEEQHVRGPAPPSLASKGKMRTLLTDDPASEDINAMGPAGSRGTPPRQQLRNEDYDKRGSGELRSGVFIVDTLRDVTSVNADGGRYSSQASSSSDSSQSDSSSESEAQDEPRPSSTTGGRQNGPVLPTFRRLPPTVTGPAYQAPFRSVGNMGPSSLFNTTASTHSNHNGYSFSAPREPPPFATTSAGPSAKQRILAKVQEQQKRIGVPISVPREGSRGSPPAPAARDGFAIDDERALNRMMQNLDVADDASPRDQEAALKELVAGTSDMASVVDFEAPDGLACTLLPHQEIGVRWLLEREKGKKRGGILGDDMGLGKTIQLIALMLANPSDRVKTKAKTTLVVCPVALMDQWKAEIAKHTDGRLKVLIHHGPLRTSESRKLAKYDVVITSYPTLSSEWVDPHPKKSKKGNRAAASDDDLDELERLGKKGSRLASANLGALFGLEHGFYRVILDEAHQIKNRTTKMQKACVALDSYYRWCLTGTPIQNEIMDLFSLFEFLGRRVVNPLHEVSEFKAKIQRPISGKRTKLALARLGVVLTAIMLRRRKTDFVDGKPLLSLPPREVIEVKGPFLDPKEAEFYEKIEEKMREAMQKFKVADIMKNYTQVLVKLLRMRQACNHPGLVLKSEADMDALEVKPDAPASSTASSTYGPASTNDDDLSSMLGSMSLASTGPSVVAACAVCSKALQKARVDAGESVCASCEGDMSAFAGMRTSTKVRKTLEILEQVKRESDEAVRHAAQLGSGSEDGKMDVNGKGKAAAKPLGPKKTIIFSQFTSMFSILEPFLDKAGYRYVRYDGSMNTRERAEALHTIRTDPRCLIILVSLKCGAVGLNLTVCSRVILLDLWWNPAIEKQAFDRAHRYGQQDGVKIYKLVIDGTVEDRILTLQQQKSDLAKAALDGEGDFAKAQKLSVQDILYLFRGDGVPARGLAVLDPYKDDEDH